MLHPNSHSSSTVLCPSKVTKIGSHRLSSKLVIEFFLPELTFPRPSAKQLMNISLCSKRWFPANDQDSKGKMITPGVEPGISWFVVKRLAIGPRNQLWYVDRLSKLYYSFHGSPGKPTSNHYTRQMSSHSRLFISLPKYSPDFTSKV